MDFASYWSKTLQPVKNCTSEVSLTYSHPNKSFIWDSPVMFFLLCRSFRQ